MRGTNFAELSAFVAVAEHRSFAKAAAYLGISPPTLSQTIRALEDRLGVRLLNRTTRSVALTEAGERLLAHMQPIVEGVDRASEALSPFRDKPMGSLRLSVARTAAITFLAPLIPAFLAEYPDINLEISVDDSNTDIVQERFDAGIRIGERIEQDMIALKIGGEIRIIAVASPAYLALNPAPETPKDLRAHKCIQFRRDWDGTILRWIFERGSEHLDVAVQGTLIVNDMDMALRAAVAGVGIAFLSDGYALRFIADGGLVPLLEEWCPHRSFFVYYSSRRQIPQTLQAFIAFVRKHSNGRAAAGTTSSDRRSA